MRVELRILGKIEEGSRWSDRQQLAEYLVTIPVYSEQVSLLRKGDYFRISNGKSFPVSFVNATGWSFSKIQVEPSIDDVEAHVELKDAKSLKDHQIFDVTLSKMDDLSDSDLKKEVSLRVFALPEGRGTYVDVGTISVPVRAYARVPKASGQ